MFEKLKSFFKKPEKEEEQPLDDIKNFQRSVGSLISPLLIKFFQYKKNPPDGINKKDWSLIKESILWSFSSLKNEKGYINKRKNEKHRERIKKGLILFGRHIDNFKL